MKMLLTQKQHQLAILAKTLDGHSPAKKISSGYAYVENEHSQSVRSVTDIKPSDELRIHLIDGTVKAIVVEVHQNE